MKKIIIIILALLAPKLIAQLTEMEAGILLGQERLGVKQWNKSIQSYNALTLQFPDSLVRPQQPILSKGISYGVFFAYRIKNGITLIPEIGFTQFNSKTNVVIVKNKLTNFRISAKIYPFYFSNSKYFTRLKKNVFVQLTPSYGIFKNATTLSQNTVNRSTSDSGKLITLGLGIGYDLFASEKISITPTFQLYFNPKAEIVDFSKTLHGEEILLSGLKDKNALWDFHIGVRVGYVIKPTLPLCTIPKCNVRMEHRHKAFGVQLVRGSVLAFKQNRRFGERYKEQKVIILMKKIGMFFKKIFGKKEK